MFKNVNFVKYNQKNIECTKLCASIRKMNATCKIAGCALYERTSLTMATGALVFTSRSIIEQSNDHSTATGALTIGPNLIIENNTAIT